MQWASLTNEVRRLVDRHPLRVVSGPVPEGCPTRTAIRVLLGVIAELAWVEERARLLVVDDRHVGANATLLQGPEVLYRRILAVGDRPLDVQVETEARPIQEVQEGLVVL